MDPRDVLNLPSEFTVEQLRHHYKALARQLHPDKRRVSDTQATETFQLLTEAYRALLDGLERKRMQSQERSFSELREDARSSERAPDEAVRARPAKASVPVGSGQAFDASRFNRAFDENRMPDPVVDGGYGRWMQETQPEQAARLLREAQRRQHDDHQRRLGAVQVYREPEPLQLTNRSTVAYTELGATGVDDYSRGEVCARHSIQYTDYRLAHSTERLAEEEDFAAAVERTSRELRSMKALQTHRANISYEMNADDQRAYDAAQRAKEQRERDRMRALSRYDNLLN
jgi:curved DNA-binding protein CbpA